MIPTSNRERPVPGAGSWLDGPDYRHMGPGYYNPPPVSGTFDHPKMQEIKQRNFLIGLCPSKRGLPASASELSRPGYEHMGPG